jgi:archaeosine-15-forming tRNA-guanine transglycosylase
MKTYTNKHAAIAAANELRAQGKTAVVDGTVEMLGKGKAVVRFFVREVINEQHKEQA